MVKLTFDNKMKEYLWRIPLVIGVTWGTVTAAQKFTEGSSNPNSQVNQLKKVDVGTQVVVKKINDAIYLLKQCPFEKANKTADRFEELNSEAKLTYLGSGVLSDQLVSVTTSHQDSETIAQIAISQEHLINDDIDIGDLAADIYKSVYIFDRIKDNPRQYSINPDFKKQLEAEADLSLKSLPC